MKLKFLVCMLFISIGYLSLVTRFNQKATAWPNGISGFSGSTSTGNFNCNTCHIVSSEAKTKNFGILSTIPATGYLPNTAYDFSIIVKSSTKSAGFNVRIENEKGELAGEITNKDSTTRLERGELIHTYYSQITNGLGQFDFTWTSPSAEENVQLYAAIASVIDTSNVIDTLNLLNFSFYKDVATGLPEDKYSNAHLSTTQNEYGTGVYYTLPKDSKVTISLIDPLGIEYFLEQNESKSKGQNFYQIENQNRNFDLALLKISFDQTVWTKKVF